MGGRGASSGAFRGSKDGTILGGKPREIESYIRDARGFSPRYHGDTILEATTDGHGNLTFSYARANSYEKNGQNEPHNVHKVYASGWCREWTVLWDQLEQSTICFRGNIQH